MPDGKRNQFIAQREVVNVRIRRVQNKKMDIDRRDDTLRKVVAGAEVQEWTARSGFLSRLMNKLGSFLVRTPDQTLFGLPSKEEGQG